MAAGAANVSESVGASWNLRAKEVEEAKESGNRHRFPEIGRFGGEGARKQAARVR